MNINFISVNHNVPNPDEQIDSVPPKAGIYGWYYNFNRLQDFTNNPTRIKKELLSISIKLKSPEFKTFLSAKFGNSFKGEVEHNSKFKEKDINERVDALSEKEIQSMLSILENFTQPLYIGIADNLRKRYNTHYKSISENICDTDRAKGKCFGHRVQQQEIKLEELVYKYQVLDDMDRSNIEKIEYIANRFFKPIFGRR